MLLDARGVAVPERLHAAFAGVPAAKRITAKLRDAVGKLESLANVRGREVAPCFALADVPATVADVLKAVAWVEGLLPGSVCGSCNGGGRGACERRGFLPANAVR